MLYHFTAGLYLTCHYNTLAYPSKEYSIDTYLLDWRNVVSGNFFSQDFKNYVSSLNKFLCFLYLFHRRLSCEVWKSSSMFFLLSFCILWNQNHFSDGKEISCFALKHFVFDIWNFINIWNGKNSYNHTNTMTP